MSRSTQKRILKALLLTGCLLLLIGFLAFIFRTQLLTGLASFLIVNDDIQQPADIIYMLNGEVNTRPFHTVNLFQAGLAPRIVIPRAEDGPAAEIDVFPNDTDASVEVLQTLEVPSDKITILLIKGGVTSTRDEAVVLRHYIEEHGIERVILVTSAFHTRRTRWIFDKVLADLDVTLEITAAPQWKFDETNWWREERGLIMFTNEYLKLVYYLAVY
ncbi:MAG TPA: YdcF family protein [Anaerolineae bacterium]|jgi:uncharacterized SAM-binding protein YcdF (DUF218 family)